MIFPVQEHRIGKISLFGIKFEANKILEYVLNGMDPIFKRRMKKIKTKKSLFWCTIHLKMTRSDMVTNICTFLTLFVAYQSILRSSSLSTVSASSHMSDEDNGKLFNA